MSSACVCHTDEYCFYCEKFLPLERKTEEVHYQLYKLLAFAIQELSFYASREEMQSALSLPLPDHILSNRARMAVERIEEQNPHFFSGYIKFRSGKPYPAVAEGVIQ